MLLLGAKTRTEEYICKGVSSITQKLVLTNRIASATKLDRLGVPLSC
jgi:hypothetical protein